MTTLTLHRQGRFTVENRGTHWCGTAQHQDIEFTADVVCSVSLDDRGFLFDQLSVVKFFEGQKVCVESCERYTLRCARELYKLIKAENGGCQIHHLTLKLSPAPYGASMTLDYTEEPVNPRATGK